MYGEWVDIQILDFGQEFQSSLREFLRGGMRFEFDAIGGAVVACGSRGSHGQ